MVSKSFTLVAVVAVAFSTSAIAADMAKNVPASVFDYLGLANLGLAPENPDNIEKCRQLEQDTPNTATPPTDPSQLKATDVLSTSSDLEERKRRCAALTAAALAAAGYVKKQAAVDNSPGAAGILVAGALVGGGALLLAANGSSGSSSPSDPVSAPLPIPGAGFLSYIAMAASGAFLWLRGRMKLAGGIFASFRRYTSSIFA
jgi:hypothetical protein